MQGGTASPRALSMERSPIFLRSKRPSTNPEPTSIYWVGFGVTCLQMSAGAPASLPGDVAQLLECLPGLHEPWVWLLARCKARCGGTHLSSQD